MSLLIELIRQFRRRVDANASENYFFENLFCIKNEQNNENFV